MARRTEREDYHPACEQRIYEPDEIELMDAVEKWKKRAGRKFPATSEILHIAKGLGYRKVSDEEANGTAIRELLLLLVLFVAEGNRPTSRTHSL